MAQLLSNFDFNQLAEKSGVTFDQFCPLRDALAESFACLDQEQKIKALKNLFAAYPNLPGKAEKQSSECPPSKMADCLIHDFYEHSEGNLKVQTSFMEGLATLMPHLLANMPAWDHRAPDAYAKYLGLRCYMMGNMNGRGLGSKGRWRRLDTGILMPFVGACFDAMDTCLENRILCDKGIKIRLFGRLSG